MWYIIEPSHRAAWSAGESSVFGAIHDIFPSLLEVLRDNGLELIDGIGSILQSVWFSIGIGSPVRGSSNRIDAVIDIQSSN